jgi:hypothetical protein
MSDIPFIVISQRPHPALKRLLRKIIRQHELENKSMEARPLVQSFQHLIKNLPEWVAENKFSLHYIDKNFNEVKNGQHGKGRKSARRSGSKLGTKKVFSDGGEL